MNYELIIIGGGPAGAAAAVYAARKQIKTALIAESFGGQSVESPEIQNWIGTPAISGIDLAKNFKEHVKFYADGFVEIKEVELVGKIAPTLAVGGPTPTQGSVQAENVGQKNEFLVTTPKGEYKTKAVLVATGSSRRKLDIPGAKEFEGKGITYCASCDGPFFADKDVAVIGGGNAGFESAVQLLAYCKSVTLISRGEFRADPVTVEKVLANPKMIALTNAVPTEIKGGSIEGQTGDFVKSLTYHRSEPFVDSVEIKVDGVFVEIGHMPATSFMETSGVEMDDFKHIKVDPKNQRTNIEGIWAAGDCTDGLYHQNNIAAGDAVKALEDIYLELHKTS